MDIALKMEQLFIVRVIRTGLVSLIPFLMIGAFSLVLKSFPVVAYQTFIETFAGGFLLELFNLIFTATFGTMAVYMTLFISRSYMNIKADPHAPMGGAIASALIAFFILAGVSSEEFCLDYLGVKSMFMAILTGLGATALYLKFFNIFYKDRHAVLSRGADELLNRVLHAIGPITLTVLVFALFDAAIVYLCGVESVRELIILMFSKLFEGSGQDFGSGLFFVFLSSLLWFFGIHGSDTLESVMQEYFVPGLTANQAAVAAGLDPTCILTKQFFDCFVLIGGCGTAISLLIAILIFSRNRSRRRLGEVATFPMIFNINELMVFGLPIIYNPIMFVPFIATPLVCYSIAYIALSMGAVPLITGEIEWTTPIIIGGYYATGSIAGAVLQIINVIVGVLIYMPFVKLLDKQTDEEARHMFDEFMDYFKKNESDLASVKLIDLQNTYGAFARNLTAELQHELHDRIQMYYQPQYNYTGRCVGVESLLRWNHPVFGMLYPPLVIKLAEDGGFLSDLEDAILNRVMEESGRVAEKFGEGVKVSCNVTGTTFVSERFLNSCKRLDAKQPLSSLNLCVEMTEQAAVSFDESTIDTLKQLRSMGVKLAIDDFSMGHTSINYLQNNLFDVIKLDGSLVKGLMTHENCREIISSIVQLADSLHMIVVAEYVETEEQRDLLHEIGCNVYQGWLYSPAVPLDEE